MNESDYEFVERKGLGHPDTLSDSLAEYLSVQYSNFTLKKFGAILHHNFDKVGLLGGASYVKFGEGYLIKPIRVLLNGRASTKFGEEDIPIKEMLIEWAKNFLSSKFPMIDSKKDLEFHYNLSNQSSPGKTDEKDSDKSTRKYWFEPRGLDDLQELKKLFSNDTSLGVGYYPYSKLERLVLNIEHILNSFEFQKDHLWIGSDIKIMGIRFGNVFDITLCVPQISRFVKDIDEYKENINLILKTINKIAHNSDIKNINVHINTRDNYEKSELYLTAIGSSIESGDEGLVGRGNRINGIISPMRRMSMEGACGKNPVYHVGKVYYVASFEISRKIFEKFGISNEVALISQSGRDLLDPWMTFVTVPEGFENKKEIENFVKRELQNIPHITNLLLRQKVNLY